MRASPSTGAGASSVVIVPLRAGPTVIGTLSLVATGVAGELNLRTSVRVTPVIDLNHQAPVDAYEIPAVMRPGQFASLTLLAACAISRAM